MFKEREREKVQRERERERAKEGENERERDIKEVFKKDTERERVHIYSQEQNKTTQ